MVDRLVRVHPNSQGKGDGLWLREVIRRESTLRDKTVGLTGITFTRVGVFCTTLHVLSSVSTDGRR